MMNVLQIIKDYRGDCIQNQNKFLLNNNYLKIIYIYFFSQRFDFHEFEKIKRKTCIECFILNPAKDNFVLKFGEDTILHDH